MLFRSYWMPHCPAIQINTPLLRTVVWLGWFCPRSSFTLHPCHSSSPIIFFVLMVRGRISTLTLLQLKCGERESTYSSECSSIGRVAERMSSVSTVWLHVEVADQVLERYSSSAHTTLFSILEHCPARVCSTLQRRWSGLLVRPSARAFADAEYYPTLSAPDPVIRFFSSRKANAYHLASSLIKAYVVIITLCGNHHGGSYHKSKSPQILVAVLTTGPNHHRYLWRFGSRVGQRSACAMRVPRVVRTCLTKYVHGI